MSHIPNLYSATYRTDICLVDLPPTSERLLSPTALQILALKAKLPSTVLERIVRHDLLDEDVNHMVEATTMFALHELMLEHMVPSGSTSGS